MSRYIVGDVDYSDPESVLALRRSLIELRNRHLGPEALDAGAVVTLSHTIGLLYEFVREKWPDREADLLRQN